MSICVLTQSGMTEARPLPQTSPSNGAPISIMSKSTVPVAIACCRRGVVVGLRQIDPVDLGAGIGLPRLEEAAEQQVVKVLVVEPHEGQLDALELAFLDVRLGRAEAQLADLLPVGIGGRSLVDAGDLQQLLAQITRRRGGSGLRRRRRGLLRCLFLFLFLAAAGHAQRGQGSAARQHLAAGKQIVELDSHLGVPPLKRPRDETLYRLGSENDRESIPLARSQHNFLFEGRGAKYANRGCRCQLRPGIRIA